MTANELIDDVCRWVRFACEDIETAETLLRDEAVIPRHVCWLAQQGAEKILQAALIAEQVEFPFSHDLDALRNLLSDVWRVKAEHPDLAELSEWAVEARYPGDWADATLDAARRTARQARAVVDTVVLQLEEQGFRCNERRGK